MLDMKKMKKENQYAGGKGNFEDDPKPHRDYERNGIKERGLFRNETEQSDYEDRRTGENDDYFLRANRPGYSQRNQTKEQQGTNRSNKMASVKTEIQIRSKGKYAEGKTGNRMDQRKN